LCDGSVSIHIYVYIIEQHTRLLPAKVPDGHGPLPEGKEELPKAPDVIHIKSYVVNAIAVL
jgi:hypothetical protein